MKLTLGSRAQFDSGPLAATRTTLPLAGMQPRWARRRPGYTRPLPSAVIPLCSHLLHLDPRGLSGIYWHVTNWSGDWIRSGGRRTLVTCCGPHLGPSQLRRQLWGIFFPRFPFSFSSGENLCFRV